MSLNSLQRCSAAIKGIKLEGRQRGEEEIKESGFSYRSPDVLHFLFSFNSSSYQINIFLKLDFEIFSGTETDPTNVRPFIIKWRKSLRQGSLNFLCPVAQTGNRMLLQTFLFFGGMQRKTANPHNSEPHSSGRSFFSSLSLRQEELDMRLTIKKWIEWAKEKEGQLRTWKWIVYKRRTHSSKSSKSMTKAQSTTSRPLLVSFRHSI